MLWKDAYEIGVEKIDTQHKALFDMSNHLLTSIKSENVSTRSQECINSILFLKKYAAEHFADEEAYMRSINYCDAESHKLIHKIFSATVVKFEQKMLKYNFDMSVIKEFAGFLTTWLIYHVAGADQKLKNNESLHSNATTVVSFYTHCFAQSVGGVLITMTGTPVANFIFDSESIGKDDVLIHIGIIGDYKGDAVFVFPRATTLGLLKAMISMEIDEIDEIAYSALSEMANIISGHAASIISKSGKACDITPPRILSSPEGVNNENEFQFDTEYGKVSICVNVNV